MDWELVGLVLSLTAPVWVPAVLVGWAAGLCCCRWFRREKR